MACTKCGAYVVPGVRFCSNCGASVDSEATQVARRDPTNLQAPASGDVERTVFTVKPTMIFIWSCAAAGIATRQKMRIPSSFFIVAPRVRLLLFFLIVCWLPRHGFCPSRDARSAWVAATSTLSSLSTTTP